MRELSEVVETLRLVQQARKRFMELWSLEKNVINPVLDRMADDLMEVGTPASEGTPEAEPPEASSDQH
jgi:hypothetical protein